MNRPLAILAMAMLCPLTGCYRPFEPIQLETIGTNEEGFLIPYSGDTTKQTSTNNEDFLRKNLVATKQIKIPQQWLQKGYETTGPNGTWIPAAKLIKVDKSPVTREWTADSKSGTSTRDEAIWVMTSDQVEWSTGWTCTARIGSRDDAVKFLHNYPSGSLKDVLDSEVRAKLQAIFGLAVTDLPMETLRKEATPIILNTVKEVTKFFEVRGITITNLGITGGFVYKSPMIQETMIKVFNAEQQKSIAKAETEAQSERNKKTQLEAEAKAKAILTERKAEAEGILAVAEARRKEAQVVADNPEVYMTLRRVELEKEKLTRWNGDFPNFFMGGSSGSSPDFLLQVPAFEAVKAAKKVPTASE